MGSSHDKKSEVGILLCHGYLSCRKQMEHLDGHLKELGFQTHSVCLYGHGSDPKDLNKVSWEYWLKNVEDGYYQLRKNCKKLFLVGFSMGGCLSLIVSSMKEKRVDGVIAINPCFGINDRLDFIVPWAVRWNNMMTKIGWDSLAIKYIDSGTELPSINYKRNSLHGTNELKKLMVECWSILDEVWPPCLVIQEKTDPTVLYKSGSRAFDKIASTNKEFISTDLGVHATMYLECCRDKIFGMVDRFIDATLDCSFMTIGHRGAAGHENENTIESFAKAIDLGCDMIELDVKMVDSSLVVFHDGDLERIFGIDKSVSECSYTEIRKLTMQGGGKIPTLEEALDFIDGRVKVNIELKGPYTVAAVVNMIEKLVKTKTWNYEDFLISAFSYTELSLVRRLSSAVRIGLLFSEETDDLVDTAISLASAKHINSWSVNVSGKVVSEALVNIAHREGMKVLVYTINDPEEIRTLKALGVDGIFSDYPERV
jgi:glycerophosphoryl diester phosphodiesterase